MFTKRLFPAFLILSLLTLFLGCSKENNVTGPGTETDSYVYVHLAGDSTKIELDDLPSFDVTSLAKAWNENDAVWLKDFISATLIPEVEDKDGTLFNARPLYAYRFVGEDGFYAASKGYPDNTWDQLDEGYMYTDTRNIVFPDDLLDLAGAYNVKKVRHIYANRKIDITSPDSSGFALVNDFQPQMVDNGDGVLEAAVPLMDIVETIVASPANYNYRLEAVDGYQPPDNLNWTQFRTGYWLLESAKTIFTDPNFATGKYKVKYLRTILVNQ